MWWPLNWSGNQLGKKTRFRWLSDDAAIQREIKRKRNPLEVLLNQAMEDRSLVSVTVRNSKVYIGRVSVTFNPAFGMEAINLVLSYSGHRNKETQKMTLDVDYEETHSAVRQELVDRIRQQLKSALDENPKATSDELIESTRRELSGESEIRNYEIVIPIAEVQSVNVFDMDIYNKFFAPEEPEGFVPPPTQKKS